MKKLEGKVAIVTGAGGGIGKGIALMFAEEGANVVVNDINEEIANEVTKEITVQGGKSLSVKADVSNGDQVTEMVNKTIEAFEKIDILVNNAGLHEVIGFGIGKLTEPMIDRALEVNLKSFFLTCRAVIPHLKKAKYSKIINIASIDGKTGNPAYPHYSAAKAGVVSLTQSLAKELAYRLINVNALCPGWVWTPMMEKGFGKFAEINSIYKGMTAKEAWSASVEENIPMKEAPTVEDIAKAAIFFASSDSDRITGQALNIDGGYELH
jgi:NAD(P)-dependent dehydrogenase (short-subunit alcohol dehydrogenase family)